MALKRPWESNSWMFDFTEVQRGSWGFPYSSVGKESACNAGDLGSIPGSGRSPGEGIGHPLQYSGLENSMDCLVHGVAKSQTQLSDFHSQISQFIPHTLFLLGVHMFFSYICVSISALQMRLSIIYMIFLDYTLFFSF